ncbi:MAG: YheU family protein [Acidobacteriota bacterium]|nr:YheU family protein [Acidobacteriota bacterium]
MIVPHTELEPETLINLIEAFVCRDGTDYGEVEVGMDDKVFTVRKQLVSGEAVIVFDEETGTCNIVPAVQARNAGQA